jgi:hypothetical protein
MVLALVVAGFTVLGGGQALASHARCGDTITTDTTLDSDLVNCPNNGIMVGATTSPWISTGTPSTATAPRSTPARRVRPATSACSTGLAMTG